MQTDEKHDVYEIVTNRIIELLEAGTVPWHQPWTDAGEPQNVITKIPYRGFNLLLLASLGYSRNLFLTYRQAKEMGAMIRKGEKPFPIVFWKWPEAKPDENGKKPVEKVRPILRYYQVWNIEQCEDIPEHLLPPPEMPNDPIEVCENIVLMMPKCPPITHVGKKAYYKPEEDVINIPKIKAFDSSEDYYATLFHELVHSTGHTQRLNRNELTESKGMKSEKYAIEELTAEMGASYLKSYAGIPIETFENNAAYIEHWLGHLRNDRKFIVHACAQAQKATDYILNIKPEEKEVELGSEQEKLDEKFTREMELNKVRKNRNEKSKEHGVSK